MTNKDNKLLDNANQSESYVDITPDRSIIPKLGKAGYFLYQALGELVDNSIDAKRPNHQLIVNIGLLNDRIIVSDNGKGMTKEELAKAMTLAYRAPDKEKKLGEFGIGLKSATMALGSRVVIFTLSSNNENGQTYKIDLDEEEWIKNGDWARFPITLSEPRKRGIGTTIFILKVKLKRLRSRARSVREEFGIRYAPLITSNQVVIKINDVLCLPVERRLVDNEKHPIKFVIGNGKDITGWWGLLDASSQIGHYGFNLYNNGRLICRNEKIGFTPHPELARLIGEVYLDVVPVSYNKREFIHDSPEYEEFEKKFKRTISEAVKSARNYRLDQPTEIPISLLDQIEENIATIALLNEQGKIKSNMKIINVNKKGNKAIKLDIDIDNRSYHVLQTFYKGERNEPQIRSITKEQNNINIEYNFSHPIFSITKNRALFVSYSMLEALLLIPLNDESQKLILSLLRTRDLILGSLLTEFANNA